MSKPNQLTRNWEEIDLITLGWERAYQTTSELVSDIVDIIKAQPHEKNYLDRWFETQDPLIKKLAVMGETNTSMHKVAAFHALLGSTIGRDSAPMPDFLHPEKSVVIFLTKTLAALKEDN